MNNFVFKNPHHQSVLPKGMSLSANAGIKGAVRSKGRSCTANRGTNVPDLPCGEFR